VADVLVQFLTNSGVVDAQSNPLGDYAAVIPLEAAELITIQVEHPGFQPYSVQQMLTPGDDLVVDINLQPL